VASGATWTLPASSSTSVNGGSLVNDGTATLHNSASLDIYQATVTNNGAVTMDSGAEIYGSGTNPPSTTPAAWWPARARRGRRPWLCRRPITGP